MARLFIERATAAQIAALGAAVMRAEAAARNLDAPSYVDAFGAFYAVLLVGSGNEVACRILNTLNARITYLRHLTTQRAPLARQLRTVTLLRGIFAAVQARAPMLAARRCATFVARSARFALDVLNHYNLLWREDERELLPFCRAQGIGLIPYSPMARGFLCGRTRRLDPSRTERAKTDDFTYKLYGRPADEAMVERVTELAAARGLSPAQVALAWVLHQPGVTAPIIGATQPAHVDQAIDALTIRLSAEEQRILQEPYMPRH
jgi:hypothetical protein